MIGYEIFDKLKAKYKTGEMFKILFCPYKEEMWDSMATVYERASTDEETYAKIMPIPYFRLYNLAPYSIEMEFGKDTHTDDFHAGFPHVLNEGWDVIIIHYPYDQKNTVTRPLLTSYMLKFFCKNLVFIHYAVVGDRDWKEIEVKLPAIMKADLVICESERHAQNVKDILESAGIQNEVVGWGSPKYDNLKEFYNLPKEWASKVRDKRVILFQTSIIPYMNHTYKLSQITTELNNLMSDDNVCVWWRPHPLYEETILSLRPDELKRFRELKDMVRNSRHILDETEDLHRAICMTDEMVSDMSSVVTLYKKTGKPIRMMEER